jgi:chromosomal replication initiation ATPase DnaA
MSGEVKRVSNGGETLSDFLQLCVSRKVLEEDTARDVHRLASTSGCGLIEAVRGLGLMSREQFVEKVLSALSAKRAYHPLLLQRHPGDSRRFERFYAIEPNEKVVDTVRAMAGGRGSSHTSAPLVLHAPPGLGKTHLLCAAVVAGESKNSTYVHSADLDVEIQRANRLGCRAELRRRLISAGLLAVDDIHLLAKKEEAQEELAVVIDHASRSETPVIMASALHLEALEGLSDELSAKLGPSPWQPLLMGSAKDRLELIDHLEASWELPGEVKRYLAENIADSVRRIKAAAVQLRVLAGEDPAGVTVEMARAVVPLPADLRHGPKTALLGEKPLPQDDEGRASERPDDASRFKEMVASAENEQEQALALQIALNQRLRTLREQGGGGAHAKRLEEALELLREGKTKEALRSLNE